MSSFFIAVSGKQSKTFGMYLKEVTKTIQKSWKIRQKWACAAREARGAHPFGDYFFHTTLYAFLFFWFFFHTHCTRCAEERVF